jgi:hypothetical protein
MQTDYVAVIFGLTLGKTVAFLSQALSVDALPGWTSQLTGNGGMIVALLFALRWFSQRQEAQEKKIDLKEQALLEREQAKAERMEKLLENMTNALIINTSHIEQSSRILDKNSVALNKHTCTEQP